MLSTMGHQETLRPTCKPLEEQGEIGLWHIQLFCTTVDNYMASDEMLQYVSETKWCMRVKILHLCDGENTKPLEPKHVVASVHYCVTV